MALVILDFVVLFVECIHIWCERYSHSFVFAKGAGQDNWFSIKMVHNYVKEAKFMHKWCELMCFMTSID